MSIEEDIKKFIDDRPNPFLKRFVVKMIKDNNLKVVWKDKTDPKEYYGILFKTIKGELHFRPGLKESYLQYQIAENLAGTGKIESERIAGMMQISGVFSLQYSRLVKEFQKSKNWDEEKFNKIWKKAIENL